MFSDPSHLESPETKTSDIEANNDPEDSYEELGHSQVVDDSNKTEMETVPALETEGEVQGQDQQENQEEEKSYFDEEAQESVEKHQNSRQVLNP